jgi:hypothetical protein
MSFCRDVRITRSAAGRANRELGSRLNANDRLNLAPYLSSPRVHGLYTCGPGQARYQLLSIVKSAGIALAGNSHKGRRNLSASQEEPMSLSASSHRTVSLSQRKCLVAANPVTWRLELQVSDFFVLPGFEQIVPICRPRPYLLLIVYPAKPGSV